MLLTKVLLGLAGLFASIAVADSNADLGSVLGAEKNLTKYYDLIKKYPDILLQLPSYKGVTIIAPSDKAFDNIPYTALNGQWDPADKAKTVPLLQYHILQGTVSAKGIDAGPTFAKTTLLTDPKYTNVTSGQSVLVDKQSGAGANVIFTSGMGTRCSLIKADIEFQGGLIQIVDNLLIPPARLDKTAEAFKVPSFLGGLYAAKLMPDTNDRKNVTIFAPQDDAIGLIGGGLEKMDAEQLARVMGYHVIPDQVLISSALTNNTKLKSLATDASGKEASVVIRQSGNNKYVNSAQIVQPDILIANGVLHIISNVLNPDAESVLPNPSIGTQAPVFSVSSIKGAFTSALPCTTNCPVTTTTAKSEVSVGTTTTPTTSFFSSSSKAAALARCTAPVAGAAAVGLLGVGAGLAPWL